MESLWMLINIQSDSIVRQMSKVYLLSYTTMNNNHIFNDIICLIMIILSTEQ